MNYANMIEEKNLKKTFIIATLCSTLVGTFTSSMGLWDRVQDKRKQDRKDTKQDDEIKSLRERVEKAEKRSEERNHRPRQRDDVRNDWEEDQAMIQQAYDKGYARLGRKFAQGDMITENQLQAQVIYLQQKVIAVLEDALSKDRRLNDEEISDLRNKLKAASDSARDRSISALNQQQLRLSGRDASPPRSLALGPPKRASTIASSVVDTPENPLFCRYSTDLQFSPKKPLVADFDLGRTCRCPSCFSRIDAAEDDWWKIGKCTPILVVDKGYEKEILETREFVLGQRFVVKCHTPDGRYACVLCNQFRKQDAICRTVEALVRHVGNYHDINEILKDRDLRELDVERTKLLLEAPRAPSPPPVREFKEVRETVYR